MRRIAAALVIAACVAGFALAEEAPVAEQAGATPFNPSFEQGSFGAARHAYPDSALSRGVAGVVHLCCTAGADRRVNCQIGVEWPSGQGFGAAGQHMVGHARLTPESYAALQTRPGAVFREAIRWQTEPAPPELDGVVERINNETHDLCGPGTGDAPEYMVISAERVSGPTPMH